MNPNQIAFLALISHSEGTDRVADSYRVCFSFKHYIVDLTDHPAVTLEWTGEPLDFMGLKYYGKKSTAAGRYQINKSTWLMVQAALKLPDFTASSQDAAALWLIREAGALADVNAGNVVDAIIKCHNIWASLPGGTSGQPEMRLAECVGQFISAGGTRPEAA